MNRPNQQQRFLGGLYGSLVGDALGVPVEFKPRNDRLADPVTGMRDYGTHGQPAGTWSDDGALLLCSAESLVEAGFDTQDMGERFVRWYEGGLWTAHGTIFDIGIATRSALNRIRSGIPAEQAGGRDEFSNGNGSLMRILPVVLAALKEDEETFWKRIHQASAITHGHLRSQMACVFYGLMVRAITEGLRPETALMQAQSCFAGIFEKAGEFGHFSVLMQPSLQDIAESQIGSGGYVLDTLTASLWCLLTTSSFAECVLKAVNLGDDTDTTGCVAGGLAGIYYGLEAIPQEWLEVLPRQGDLRGLFERFNSLFKTL
ncbi:ADP-ribosylglycohydrolase family protein [Prosthecobacter sp. SYSU 5D2]|uniref:ADP-ribosylglycohydrolase family protein n=1 Tax=Prosthecobacter sp. SYSU 5D2 TaxID=3134134 RepID=UPI0031FED391